jgi:single-strand DNA-binding protein
VGVNRFYKALDGALQQEVSFFDVDAWGALAQACKERCDKGRGVRVVGRLRQNRWVDTEGHKKSRVVVVAEHVEFRQDRDKKTDDELHDLADAASAQALAEDDGF